MVIGIVCYYGHCKWGRDQSNKKSNCREWASVGLVSNGNYHVNVITFNHEPAFNSSSCKHCTDLEDRTELLMLLEDKIIMFADVVVIRKCTKPLFSKESASDNITNQVSYLMQASPSFDLVTAFPQKNMAVRIQNAWVSNGCSGNAWLALLVCTIKELQPSWSSLMLYIYTSVQLCH